MQSMYATPLLTFELKSSIKLSYSYSSTQVIVYSHWIKRSRCISLSCGEAALSFTVRSPTQLCIAVCICMSMCSIPTCLCATLKSLFNSVDDPPPPPPPPLLLRHLLPPLRCGEVRAPLFIPLLIISLNLRKRAVAAVSTPRLEAATGTRTPFLFTASQHPTRGSRGTDVAEKRGEGERRGEGVREGGERVGRKWALTPGK